MQNTLLLFFSLIILVGCQKDDSLVNPFSNQLSYITVIDKTYNLVDASDILETSQGGYLVAGRNKTGTMHQGALLRLDVNGNELWNKTFSNGTNLCSVIEVKGSGYIAVGDAISKSYVVRTDYEGNIIWEAYIDFDYCDAARKVIQTSDAGYLVIVNSYATNGSARLTKLNDNGVEVWVKIIQGEPAVKVYSVKENNDSTLSLIGTSKTYTQTESWYITLDKDGNELNRKSIDQNVSELGSTFYEYSICRNSLGNYAGCGLEYLFLFNADGDLLVKNSAQLQEGFDWLRMYSVNPYLNNGFVACGFQEKQMIVASKQITEIMGSLFFFDSDGTFTKSIIIGEDDSILSSVVMANDNSIVSVGYKSGSVWVKKIKLYN